VLPYAQKTLYERVLDPNAGEKLSTGDPVVDECLQGGLPRFGLIEVAGEAFAGKTNLMLQLLLQTTLPKHHGGAQGVGVCIYTEGSLPWKRYEQIRNSYCSKYSDLNAAYFDDNIVMHSIASLDQLDELAQKWLRPLFRKKPVKLVVIDSIAALFRTEFDAQDSVVRAENMAHHAHQLKMISDEFTIPIVVTNQVADLFLDSFHSTSRSTGVIPTL